MADRPSTTLVMAAYDAADRGHPAVRMAQLAVDGAMIDRYRGAMDDFDWLRDRGTDVSELVLHERAFTFLDVPAPIYRGTYDPEDAVWSALEDVVEQGREVLELPPAMVPELPSAMGRLRKEAVQAVVHRRPGVPVVEWRSYHRTARQRVDTPAVRHAVWLRLYLRAADSRAELRTRFREVVRLSPRTALDALRGGLDYDAGFAAPIALHGALEPADLQPLLASDRAARREAALAALGRIEGREPEDRAGGRVVR